MSRRQTREEAFKLIFEISFKNDEFIHETLQYYFENTKKENIEKDYLKNVVFGVFEYKNEFECIISEFSIGWNKNRISRIIKSALFISFYEIKYRDDIPNSVSIFEAVELAKKYEGPESGVFVNGILGSYLRFTEGIEN